uniref:Uncharacterized protein n=1 Tax=Uncultured archaeon GZfos26G2 TaxID=3386331 RepID=A0A7H0XRZ8_UNCAG|nr:hypothetical protein GZ17G11_38 [uncultured archaeon GZfos17G11]
MRQCISAIWASAFSTGAQSATTHSPSPLTSSPYPLTSSSTSTHTTHLILSPSRKNTDSHNMALGTSQELLHHTFLSTTFWGAMGNSCRMDKGCPFPYLFLVQNQTKNLFQILFLLPFLSPPFKFFHSLLHFFQIFRQSICHVR